MKKFIVLSEPDILALYHNKTVTVRIDEKPYLICSDEYFEKQMKSDDALNMAIETLEKEKADEATDHPEWIDYEDGLWKYAKCPVCGSVRNTKTPFCPICGTKMKGVIGK